MDKYVIVRDTREKKGYGWTFRRTQSCSGMVHAALSEGDYTLQGLESVVAIERKGNVSELAKNLTEKRFEEELKRLDDIRFPFMLLEFEVSDVIQFPVGSNVPKYKWRYLKVKGPFILRKVCELIMQYRTRVIFCGNRGQDVATSIFKRVAEVLNRENRSSKKVSKKTV